MKPYVYFLAFVIVAAAGAVFAYTHRPVPIAPMPVLPASDIHTGTSTATSITQPFSPTLSIEQTVRQNISTLSPVQEQLGGTFYVTQIQANYGVGAVSYEDGHNAYTADFTYKTHASGEITITSFLVR